MLFIRIIILIVFLIPPVFCYAETEETGDASIEDLNKAIAANPKNADIYYNRGLAHAQSGDTAEAIKDFTKAIALIRRNADAFYYRGRAHI